MRKPKGSSESLSNLGYNYSMEGGAEHFKKTAENFYFQLDFIHALQNQTSQVRKLRVLDFGAGPTPTPISTFGVLQKDQEAVAAYDPTVTTSTRHPEKVFGAVIQWTNQAPIGEKFHLIVCHFSLHHVKGDLNSIIKELMAYSPEIIAIADYDFTKSTLEDFEKTFISEQELKELNTLFRGDRQACFDYHKRLGIDDFKRGLQESGFTLVASRNGNGIAQNKFYLIGQK